MIAIMRWKNGMVLCRRASIISDVETILLRVVGADRGVGTGDPSLLI